MLPHGGQIRQTGFELRVGRLDILNTDREDHTIVAGLGGIRMQRLEDPDAGVGSDLEFDESFPLVDDRKPQSISVEGNARLPRITKEDRVQTPNGQHVRLIRESWSGAF
jgi:hypothetical protein